MKRLVPALAVLALGVSGAAAQAPQKGGRVVDADWPCPQRLVPQLTATQIWDGPSVDAIKDWSSDAAVRDLVHALASRRITQDEAIAKLKAFAAQTPDAERDQKLTKVFAGLLQTVNTERSTVIGGIIRFEQRQRGRSKELEREGTRIGDLKAKAVNDAGARAELENAQQMFDWNVRVFQERQSNTPIACEIPVLMESRIFEVAREIRALMKS